MQVLCDPQVLLPEQSCDGKWHMFVHSWIGIHHYISSSGIAWEPRKMIVFRGHSPFIFIENENYYLIYENHDRNISVGHKKPDAKRDKYSCIEMRTSTDLVSWSEPRVLLDSRTIPFAGDYLKYPRISRPQLIKTGDEYRLYFGASHLKLPDTGQKVSRYFASVSATSLTGPYTMQKTARPLLQPIPDDQWANLGCGSIRVVPCGDVLYAFQCPVYWDSNRRRTSSCMLLLKSYDGYEWQRCSDTPILTTSEHGWSSSYIMGCDVHFKQNETCWYCYFSASGTKTVKKLFFKLNYKTESVGLLVGSIPDRRLRS